MDNIEYRGFTGVVFYDGTKKEYVAGIKGAGPVGAPLVAARAATYEELEKAFRTRVDQYDNYANEMGADSASGLTVHRRPVHHLPVT